MGTDERQRRKQLLDDLKSSSAITRCDAVNKLAPLIKRDAPDKRVLEALLECLEDKEPVELESQYSSGELANEAGNSDVLQAAANALGVLGPRLAVVYPQVFDRLLTLFQKKSGSSGAYIAGVLGASGDTRAVIPLIATLKEEDTSVVSAAAQALSRIRDGRAVEPLIQVLQKILQQQDKPVFSNTTGIIANALGRFDDSRAVEPLIQVLEQIWMGRSFVENAFVEVVQALVRLSARQAVDLFINMLRDPRPWWRGSIKIYIIDALWKLKVTEASELIITSLIADLETEGWYDRAQAAYMLGKSGAVEATGPLLAHLHDQAKLRRDMYSPRGWVDDAARVRAAAAEALGKLKAIEAVDPLISCLQDSDWSVQSNAAKALGDLGGEQAIKPLLVSLVKGDWHARSAFVEALGKLGAAEAIEPLLTYLQPGIGRDPGLRAVAAEALGKLGAVEAIEPLIACLQDKSTSVRASAVRALGMLSAEQAVEPLIACLQDESIYVRETIVQVLGIFGNARVIIPLSMALQDPAESVRRQALMGLQKLSAAGPKKPDLC